MPLELDIRGFRGEEGTAAAGLRPRVSGRVSRERLNRLNELLEVRAQSKHQEIVGSHAWVIIDSLEPEDGDDAVAAIGRTAGQAPDVDGVTYVEGTLPLGTSVGDIVQVTVTGALGYDLTAVFDAS